MSKKVDKVSGKGLSTNDFTSAEKQKLAGIEAGANKFSLSSNSVTASKIAYGAVSSSHSLCLDADSWQNLRQSLVLSVVSDTSAVIVSPREDSFESYCDASIRCVSQQSGSLTFACKSIPTADVYVNILLINK